MSLEKEIQKLTAAVEALTVVMRDAHNAEWLRSAPGTPAPESVREQYTPGMLALSEAEITEGTRLAKFIEELEAAPTPEPEASAAKMSLGEAFEDALQTTFAQALVGAPPPTLDDVKAAFRAMAGRVGDVATNQQVTADLLRAHGGGEPPHLKRIKPENYAALLAAVEAAP